MWSVEAALDLGAAGALHARITLQERPFKPFRLVLSDGACFDVQHPDLLWVGAWTAYVAGAKGFSWIVVDGVQGLAEGEIETVAFTPDSSAIWHVDRIGSKKRLVIGDAKGDEFDDLRMFTFSGVRPAYVGRRNQKLCVVAGGLRSQDFDEVWALEFQNGGKSVAFDARDGNDLWRVTMNLE